MTAITSSVRKGIIKTNQTVMTSAYLSTNQASLNGSMWTKLLLNTILYDVGLNYDTANHKFVTPVTGFYHLQASVHFTSVITAKRYIAALYQNGTAIKYEYGHSNGTNDISVIVEADVFLKQNDYIELFANPDVGSGTNTVAALSGSLYTTLTARLVTKEGIKQ